MKRILWVCLLVLGLLIGWSVFIGADFYVIPVKGQFTSWDKIIPGATRFKLVLDGQAVLDRETGLVWEKSAYWTGDPETSKEDWYGACELCIQRNVGSRKGWRLPTIEELASLVDTSVSGSPKLPTDHPFTNVQLDYWYWSSFTRPKPTNQAWRVRFSDGMLGTGNKDVLYYVWCVRGGYGHDAY